MAIFNRILDGQRPELLTQAGGPAATFTLQIKDLPDGAAAAAQNDVLRIKSASADNWLRVTQPVGASQGGYRDYTVERVAGSSATFPAGSAIANFGPSGTPFISLSADGTIGRAPNISMGYHSGSPWNELSLFFRAGNLRDSYGFPNTSDVFGVAMGLYGATGRSWAIIDEAGGLRLGEACRIEVTHLDRKRGVLRVINGKGGKRFQSPLTFYDPVDLSRNVASALSLEKFCLFVHACKEYRASPDMRYFFPNKRMNLSSDEIRKREDAIGHPIVFASCKRPDIVDDNLYPQARKTLDGLVTQLEKDDFCILDKALTITKDEVVFGLLLETDVLSPTYKHIGPPVTMANSKTFLARWKGEAKVGPYIENGRWVAIVKRDVKNADVALIKALTTASLGDSFKDCDIKVFNTKQHLRDGHLECATKLLDKRMSWEI